MHAKAINKRVDALASLTRLFFQNDSTMTFSQEELQALKNIIQYANKDITPDDEPLIDVLYEKVKNEIKIN